MMVVTCGQCGTQLNVPVTLAGKQGRCLKCQGVVDIPFSYAAPTSQPMMASLLDEADEYRLSAPSQPTMPALDLSNYAPKGPAAKSYDGVFSGENWGLDAGVLGGMGLMLLAVVWFFGGLFLLDRFFIYPPIMFVVGFVACIRGAFTHS